MRALFDLVLVAVFYGVLSWQSAQADVESGPAAGTKLSALKVSAVTGDHEGKDVDYASERKDKPTVYVFIQADRFDRPTARFLKVLDGAVGKLGGDAQVVAVWLTADADKSKAYLPKAQRSIKLETTALTVFAGDKSSGPEGWGINEKANVTAIVTGSQKVAKSFAYISLNETDVPAVERELKKVLGK